MLTDDVASLAQYVEVVIDVTGLFDVDVLKTSGDAAAGGFHG